jgi:hypothetical protein
MSFFLFELFKKKKLKTKFKFAATMRAKKPGKISAKTNLSDFTNFFIHRHGWDHNLQKDVFFLIGC